MSKTKRAPYRNADVVRYPRRAVADAAARFPTPFFLYDEARIRRNCRTLKAAFTRFFNRFEPLFAVKANPNPHVLKIVLEEGFGFDCSSPSELWLARRLGAGGMYTGNYTTREEYAYALDTPGMLLNLDDASAVQTVAAVGMPPFISFRLNPGVTLASGRGLALAGPDAKFGVPRNRIVAAFRAARKAGAGRLGLHAMTGSNVRDERYFRQLAGRAAAAAGEVARELNVDIERVNLGGGFGVPYRPEERPLDLAAVARGIRAAFDAARGRLGEPVLMVEPGRYLTADAGFLITKVHAVKDGYRRFVGVDAGMNDLPRPAIYGAYHHVSVLGRRPSGPAERVNVVGRLCENNDQFARDRLLPRVGPGAVLVIHNAGAHAYAMGHNYNGRPRAAEYLLTAAGELKLIRRAETIPDLYAGVVDPPFINDAEEYRGN
jgi:diaminopimelate decarboxylase